MGIFIESIRAKNLGPLNDFNVKLGLINLIYGHNEKGKTYLVEFIYRSLFKNTSLTNLRSFSANGQVVVSGIESREISFSPTTKRKLEDYLETDQPGLPRDFSKLLVVKGGELDLSPNNPAGLDDQILKDFLSGEVLLDRISKKISSTASSASYDGQHISGAQRGQVKDYTELMTKISEIDQYIEDVNKNISGGKRFELMREIEKIKEQLDLQEHAKRYMGYRLSKEISRLESELNEIPAEQLNNLEKLLTKHRDDLAKMNRKKQDLTINRGKAEHYEWLDTAVNEYQRIIAAVNPGKNKIGALWLVLTILSALSAIALAYFNQSLFGIGAIFLVMIFGFLYFKIFQKAQSNELQKTELNKIEETYKEKFNHKENVGSALLSSKLKELHPYYYSIKSLEDEIIDYISDVEKSEFEIKRCFKQLAQGDVGQEDWDKAFDSLASKRKMLEKQFQKLDKELARLDLDEGMYIKSPVYLSTIYDETRVEDEFTGQKLDLVRADADESNQSQKIADQIMEYDRSKQEELYDLLNEKKDELDEAEDALENLKSKVSGRTGSVIGIPWEDLIEKLTLERANLVNNYKEVTASILAQIKVNEVLGELRQIEEARIQEGLVSPVVTQAVLSTTGHYHQIEKIGKDIVIADDYSQYKLSDLSTGSREQVLLGLRLGFAAKILAGKSMFLILDDAFQHSDWQRREMLVGKIIELAKTGWQIIYFTMDDHIRKLFEETVRPNFANRFASFDLNNY